MLAANVSYVRTHLFLLGVWFSKLSHLEAIGTGAKGDKGRMCIGPVPSIWVVTASVGDQAESEKQDRRLRGLGRAVGFQRQLRCEWSALRWSFSTGGLSYDPLSPRGGHPKSRAIRAPISYPNMPTHIVIFHMSLEGKSLKENLISKSYIVPILSTGFLCKFSQPPSVLSNKAEERVGMGSRPYRICPERLAQLRSMALGNPLSLCLVPPQA